MLLGIRLHRPPSALPWLLLGAGTTTLIAGDIIYDVLTNVLGRGNPFPSAADVLYLVSYPLFAAGLLLMVRARSGGSDRGTLLDALVVTIGLALLSWVYLVKPYVEDASLTLLEKSISVAYPLGDILVLAVLARLVIGGARSRAAQLLVVGVVGLLVADVLYGLTQLNGAWSTGGPVDAGWIVFYAAFGAAALQPDMVALVEPTPKRRLTLTRSRLLLLTTVSFIAPVLLLLETTWSADLRGAPVIAVVSAVLFVLVTARLDGLILVARGSARRELALRRAADELVASLSRDDITRAAVHAFLEISGGPHRHRVLLALENERGLGLVHDTAVDAGARAIDLLGLAATHAARLREKRFVLLGAGRRGRGDPASTPMVLVALSDQDCMKGVVGVSGPHAHRAGVVDAVGTICAQMVLALESKALMARRTEATFRALIHNASDVILVVDADLRIVYQTPSVEAVLGYLPAEIQHRQVLDLFPDEPGLAAHLGRAGQQRVHSGPLTDWRMRHADGSVLRAEVTCRDLRDDPSVNGFVLTLRDVTARRVLEEDLKHLAFHDSLTGLPNRSLFLDRVEHASLRRVDDQRWLAVMLIDLDDFKLVNDSRGHAIGDALLVAAGDRLRSSLRVGDTAARLGGDEFAVLVEEIADEGEAEAVAQRVLTALREPYLIEGEQIVVGASLGVATSQPGETGPELLRRADLAMYAAKDAGKGGHEIFRSALDDRISARLQLRRDLERSLERAEFLVHYQPLVELTTGAITGFEALVRWQHPTRGLVMPGEFIGVVEDTNLALPLGAMVLDRAVAQAAAWAARFPDRAPLRVSVNEAPRQLRDPGFGATVASTLTRHAYSARALMLEITERTLAGEDAQAVATMSELRALGVSFALDDFGTGYSALAYLRRFPVDVLKIDRAFVRGIEGPGGDRELVEAIVRLGGAFGLQIVAEGIETEPQRAALLQMGCGAGQGYLFSPPVPAGELTDMLVGQLEVGAVRVEVA